MQFHEYNIDDNYKSVYLYLKKHGFSENYITNLRKSWGFINVNNEIVNINKPLEIGDTLKINANPNTKTSIMHCILPLDIVYEDDFYLIVNKPSGLATMPSRSHYTENLSGAICYYMGKKTDNFVLRIINRLDKDTAGLIIVAKDSISQKELNNVKKTYHALCHGKIDESLTINSPIETTLNKLNYNNNKRIISTQGKEATTFVKPIKYIEKYDISLIELNLKHGRTHQIRVHMSSINHPLLGDIIYGEENSLINHTALVCKTLEFIHPFTNKKIFLDIPYPEDFKALI